MQKVKINFQLELIKITLHRNALERIIAALKTFTKLSFGTTEERLALSSL